MYATIDTNACVNQHLYTNIHTITHIQQYLLNGTCTTPYIHIIYTKNMKPHRYINTHTTLYIHQHTHGNIYITTRIQQHMQQHRYNTIYTTRLQQRVYNIIHNIAYTSSSIQHRIYSIYTTALMIHHLYNSLITSIQPYTTPSKQ